MASVAIFQFKRAEDPKYCLAVHSDMGLMITDTYATIDELKDGYASWKTLANDLGKGEPVPLEILEVRPDRQLVVSSIDRKLLEE
ncbi:MAG: hypothetical protein AABX19_03310 [Nanoarchaeota archaeon]